MSEPRKDGLAPAALTVKNPSGGKERVPIGHLPFRIGRHGDNELVLRDSRASRQHAQIVSDGGAYVVEDMASTYGVFVNGSRVTRSKLRSGDRIEFGFPDSYLLTFGVEKAVAAAVKEPEQPSVSPGLSKLRATLEAARALETSLSTDEVLAAVVEAALAITSCERGFLLLRKGGDLEVRVARSKAGPLAPADLRVPTRLLLRALDQRKDFLSMNFDPSAEASESGELTIYALELRSVVCVPLVRLRTVTPDETVSTSNPENTAGLLYMDSRVRQADLSSGGRELLTTLALEASTVLENARLLEQQWARKRMEEELRIARQIQQSLLPRALPSEGWFRAAATSIPSLQVGGDYVDIRPVNKTCWAAMMADVSGKGVGAALLASLLQGMFVASPYTRLTIEDMVTRVNRYLLERTGGEQYATAFYCTLDADGALRWINAGHPPVLVVSAGGRLRHLSANGTPLGMFPEAVYTLMESRLARGDKLVLYTDGVLDSENRERATFGLKRLRAVVAANAAATSKQLLAAILAALHQFTDGGAAADDVTLAVIEYQPPPQVPGAEPRPATDAPRPGAGAPPGAVAPPDADPASAGDPRPDADPAPAGDPPPEANRPPAGDPPPDADPPPATETATWTEGLPSPETSFPLDPLSL
jgi:serine phosphatase RsbU (regulator of sigma subunit)